MDIESICRELNEVCAYQPIKQHLQKLINECRELTAFHGVNIQAFRLCMLYHILFDDTYSDIKHYLLLAIINKLIHSLLITKHR